MKKFKTTLLVLLATLCLVFGLALAACGGDGGGTGTGNEGEGGNKPEVKTHTVTFDLAGGSLQKGDPITVEDGSSLSAALQTYAPTRDGYEFGKWTMNGADVTADTKMPAEDVTVTAVWKSPVTITVYKLDFEHYDVYDGGTAQTVYAYAGETFSAADYLPEHYTLNEEDSDDTVTVPAEGASTLNVYADPIYTRYTDVFESTDYLYSLEAEEGVLYLDRIGMEEGRKKSSTYDPKTGAFTFKTDGEDAFVLEGVITGEKFYYYRDTINRSFDDYLESGATLDIVSKDEVTYTSADGTAESGSYSVDAEGAKYIFTPEKGEPKAFVLIEVAGILYFRMDDGIEGWYLYDGELEGGGWSLLHFDGFGVATVEEDTGEAGETDYAYNGNGIVTLYDLGLVKLTEGQHEDVGGHPIKGTFAQSDGYEGEYIHENGRRTEVLTLDGFGGATFSAYTEEGPIEDSDSVGTYAIDADDAWLIHGYDSYYGIYMVGPYGGINEFIVYTTSDGDSTTYLYGEDTDEEGYSYNTFEEYKPELFDVEPGVHEVKGNFTYKGTEYPVDDDHKAFLYFCTDETVDLWYGEYDADYEEFVYDLVDWGEWFGYGSNELYNGEYDGMYFNDMAEDGSFTFKKETWDGETEGLVFYSGAEGKLYIDVFDKAYFLPAGEGAEPIAVGYRNLASGLLLVYEFSFPADANIPETVSNLYGLYDNYYDITADEETVTVFDLSDAGWYEIAYPGSDEGGDVVIVVTEDLAFVGMLFSYSEEDEGFLEFIFAGSVELVEEATDEYFFLWNEDIYYDELDYIEDVDTIIGIFGAFIYKVNEAEGTFLLYDGYDATYTSALSENDTLVLDGYGYATLTEGGVETKGYYSLDYTVLTFTPEDAVSEDDSIDFCLNDEDETYTRIDYSTNEGMLAGYYYETYLSEDGNPDGVLNGGLFLDGNGGFILEELVFTDDYYDYEIVTEEGTYEVTSFDQPIAGPNLIIAVLELTVSADDVRVATVYINDFFGDGGYYPFFILQDEALMGEYTAYTDDGAELGVLTGSDGYQEEGGTFVGEDANGPFSYTGYMARGFIDDKYYNVSPQFERNAEGNVVVFVVWDEEGEQTQYVFDIDEDDETKVHYRDKFYGAVAEYSVSGGYSGNYLYLDGHSVAILYNSDDEAVKTGTYAFVETMEDTYAFTVNGKVEFLFQPAATVYGGDVRYFYSVYGEEEDLVYVNDDWSILSMDGFGNATYIDQYGVTVYGEYYKVIEDEEVYCLKVTETTERIYYQLMTDEKKFSVCEGEFLLSSDGGTLYVYFGSDESIKIPNGVHTIASRAFILSGSSNIKHIDFNGVTTLEEYALTGMNALEEVVSDKILTVGPYAFVDTRSLIKVELPNCTEIAESAFRNCNGIEYVKLGKIQKIGAYAFARDVNWCSSWTLDLTAVENIGEVEIDFTAFLALKGYFGIVNDNIMVDGSKILVSGGLEGLNAAAAKLKGTTAEISYHDLSGGVDAPNKTGKIDIDLRPYIALAAAEEDPADGLAFYSLAADSAVLFEGGLASVYTKGSYSYDTSDGYPYFVADGKVTIFSYDETEGFVSVAEFTLEGATSITIGNVTYVKSDENGTAEATVGDVKVVITYKASVSTSYGVSVSLSIVSVKYGEEEATNVKFDSYDKVLEFNANGHGFTATFANGTVTIVDNGEEIVLVNTTQAVWFRLTLSKAEDGTYSLKKLEYNSYGESYPDSYYECYSSDVKEEGNLTWTYVNSSITWKITVTIPASGAPTMAVTNEGARVYAGGYYVTLKVTEDNKGIVSISAIESSGYGDTTVYKISSVTISDDKTKATVVTDNGTFVIVISELTYSPYFQLSVTLTNYDYESSEMIINGDDYYYFGFTVHVDEEGNKTLKALNYIEDFMTEEKTQYHHDGQPRRLGQLYDHRERQEGDGLLQGRKFQLRMGRTGVKGTFGN